VASLRCGRTRRGRAGPARLCQTWGDEHAQNAATYARDREKPAAQVLAEADASWERLELLLSGLDDALLRSARPGRPGQLLWEVIPGDTYQHLAEHLGYFHGDTGLKAADDAQEWACELALGMVADPRSHAVALYNLGCYYARRGDADRALPRLQAGIALDPSVAEWASTDPDFAPLRADSRLTRLLQPR